MTLERYQVRAAVWSDDQFTYELHREALGDVVEVTWGPWDDATQRRFHQRWFSPERLRIVVVDNEPVGVLDAAIEDRGVLYLSRIELLTRFQGRGLGSRLIRDLLVQARQDGATGAELHVLKANRAKQLYERLGFRTIADEDPKVRMRLDWE